MTHTLAPAVAAAPMPDPRRPSALARLWNRVKEAARTLAARFIRRAFDDGTAPKPASDAPILAPKPGGNAPASAPKQGGDLPAPAPNKEK